jgi:formyltetrahydrofolate deformylase
LLQDQLGIIARISKVIASRGANILNVYLYIDFDGGKQSPVFYARR